MKAKARKIGIEKTKRRRKKRRKTKKGEKNESKEDNRGMGNLG